MKHHNRKRLAVRKETVRLLTGVEAARIQGGYITDTESALCGGGGGGTPDTERLTQLTCPPQTMLICPAPTNGTVLCPA